MQPERLGDALSKPVTSTPYIISDGILLEGTKAVLFGLFKAGKSTLLEYTAMCIAGGIPMFGCYSTQQCTVLYVQLEMPHQAFIQRLSNISFANVPAVRDNLYITTEFYLKLDKHGDISWLDRTLAALKPKVIIIDPYYKTLSGAEDFDHVTRFTDNMDMIMDRYKVALITTTQGRKSLLTSKGDALDMGDQEMRGSTALAGWVDTIIGLRAKQGTKRRLSFTLRHGVKESLDFIVDLDKKSGLYSIS